MYEPSVQPTSHSASAEAPELENQDLSTDSLNAHLNAQIDLFPLSETDYAIAIALIDAITPEGFLSTSTEEIYQQLATEMAEHEEFSQQEVDTVLTLIQHLEPVGVGARDLQECLCIQLNNLDPDTAYRNDAIRLIEQHFKLLGNRDYNQLIRQMSVSQTHLEQIITLIQTLNPRPGNCVELT